MGWTSKGRVEGIARQVLKVEQRYGAVDPATAVRFWNDQFGFVQTDHQLDQLVTAVELQIPVIRNEKNVPDVSPVGYAVFKAKALTGTLDEDLEDPLAT